MLTVVIAHLFPCFCSIAILMDVQLTLNEVAGTRNMDRHGHLRTRTGLDHSHLPIITHRSIAIKIMVMTPIDDYIKPFLRFDNTMSYVLSAEFHLPCV